MTQRNSGLATGTVAFAAAKQVAVVEVAAADSAAQPAGVDCAGLQAVHYKAAAAAAFDALVEAAADTVPASVVFEAALVARRHAVVVVAVGEGSRSDQKVSCLEMEKLWHLMVD